MLQTEAQKQRQQAFFLFSSAPHEGKARGSTSSLHSLCNASRDHVVSSERHTIPQLQSLEEINLSVLQNSIKTVSIDKA